MISQMPHVFLTNPPLNMAETPLQYHRPLVPLGLAYLGAALEDAFTGGRYEEYIRGRLRGAARGYVASGRVAAQDNMRLSFYGQFELGALLRRMECFFDGSDPDQRFIGMSILSDGMRAAKRMLREFRLRFPTAKVLVGGPHATFFAHDFYEHPEAREGPLADFVVRNEGERAILGIVDGSLDTAAQLRENGPCLGIDPGACDYSDAEYRVIDAGQYGGGSLSAGLHVLDSLPTPAYFLFEDEDGCLPYEPDRRYALAEPAANINSSRGCPHKCTFCTIPKLAPGYRTLSPSRMVNTVEFLVKEYQVKSVFFREDNFMYAGGSLGGDRWPDVAEFCRTMIDRKLAVNWAIEARADNVVEPSGIDGQTRLELLRRAGLSGIYIGVESGSDVMLKLFAKDASVRDMSVALKACREHGVAVVATALYADPDLLLRARFPSLDAQDHRYQRAIVEERERTLRETRAFMDAHEIALDRREEYAMVGIPVSTTYQILDRSRVQYPDLVEHYDPHSRYIYPKGFRWWSTKVYEAKRRVRAYFGYQYSADEPHVSSRQRRV